jgi:hypothetical protein
VTVKITSILERFDNTRFADAAGSDVVKYCKGQAADLGGKRTIRGHWKSNADDPTARAAMHCATEEPDELAPVHWLLR